MVYKANTIKNAPREALLFRRRATIVAIGIAILSLILLSRLFFLQVIQHNAYSTLSDRNQLTLIPIEPNRGLIFDRNGILLAKNIPTFSLDIIKDKVNDIPGTIKKLQTVINISPDDIKQFYRTLSQHKPSEPIPLKIKLTESDLAKFYVNQYQFPGVHINARMIREYPLNSTTVSAVGYVGRITSADLNNLGPNYSASNFIGKLGAEKAFEDLLHGTVGYQQVEVNATGNIVRKLKETNPISGNNIYLTIDSKLEKATIDALGNVSGAVVAIQPQTGEVLALVSNPAYDPNLFVTGISQTNYDKLRNAPSNPLYNRAIRGEYPLASTIKPFISLVALEHNIVNRNFKIFDPGWFRLPNTKHVYRDWREGGHGTVNMTKAIIVSCDTYFYQLAVKMGIDVMGDGLREFGFGQATGIELSEEKNGLVATPAWKRRVRGRPWYTGDTIISGIGQGSMLTTPLQLAVATTIIANRGQHYKPTLMLKYQTPQGKMIHNAPVTKQPYVIANPKDWDTVINAMQKVITSTNPFGTGYPFGRKSPYTVAGKTGTAQLYRRKGNIYDEQLNTPQKLRNHTLFIVFAPINNPQIAVAVIAENSNMASRIARKVIDYYLIKRNNIANQKPS